MKLSLVIVALSCTIFSGCATMFSKSIYSIPINTTPHETTVIVSDRNGKRIISTNSPDTLVLKAGAGYFKRAEYLIEVSCYGYQTKEETLYFTMNKKYLENLLTTFFMPIGFLLVDPVSGAMWMPKKLELTIILKPN